MLQRYNASSLNSIGEQQFVAEVCKTAGKGN